MNHLCPLVRSHIRWVCSFLIGQVTWSPLPAADIIIPSAKESSAASRSFRRMTIWFGANWKVFCFVSPFEFYKEAYNACSGINVPNFVSHMSSTTYPKHNPTKRTFSETIESQTWRGLITRVPNCAPTTSASPSLTFQNILQSIHVHTVLSDFNPFNCSLE